MSGQELPSSPLVSVLVPTFNGRLYIESALRSLQEQDYTNLEIIVVDDGSTDDTASIVHGIAAGDSRVVLIRARHRSIAASRNEGLARARGAFITFLDHDDLCPQHKIARHVAHLARKPDAIAVFGQTLMFSTAETAASQVAREDRQPALTMSLSAALFRRSAFDRVGLLDPKFKLADDFDFILRLVESGLETAVEEEVATLHRRHPAQATADLEATRREIILALAESLRRRRATGKCGDMRHPLLAAMPL